jgi:hypothetical protein
VKLGLALREGHRLRVFQNWMLREIFGPKREKVAGGWRRLHNEELYNLYASPNIIRVINSRTMRWLGHVVHVVQMRNAYKILVSKHGGMWSLGRPRCRWEDNITMDLMEIGWEGMDWIHLAQDRDR